MEDTEKYLIHAAITADGVVERSDVVGAIFGQTEGLLGDDLDLRDLQQSSKVGRIDVEIDSQNGQSFGTVTIASTLDRVKTAILAASLETITRVGPCRATVEVTDIEDVREAKRREVVERAKELLSESFDESVMSSTEILDEVKESVRIEDISEYEGLPAGPRVGDSDAVVVVEGRADVLTLLRYGIKNAIGVEGTNVPDAVADLTQDRTTTAFLDGDRGGKLILRELAQVGDVDHVAFAPEGRSVEDLERHEVFAALREKNPIGAVEVDPSGPPDADDADGGAEGEPPDPLTGSPTRKSAAPRTDTLDAQEYEYDAHDGARPTGDRSGAEAVDGDAGRDAARTEGHESDAETAIDAAETVGTDTDTDDRNAESTAEAAGATPNESAEGGSDGTETSEANGEAANGSLTPDTTSGAEATGTGDEDSVMGSDDGEAIDPDDREEVATASDDETTDAGPESLADHVRAIVGEGTETVRLLDEDLGVIAEASADDAFGAISEADPTPYAIVLDGEFTQRHLDIAAQRGVAHAVVASTGEFVKKPIGVRVRTADQLASSVPS